MVPGNQGCERGRAGSPGVSAFSPTGAPPRACVYRATAPDTARWRTPGPRWSFTSSPSGFEPADGCLLWREGLGICSALSIRTSPMSSSLQDSNPLAFGKCIFSNKIALYFFYSIIGHPSSLSLSQGRVMAPVCGTLRGRSRGSWNGGGVGGWEYWFPK